MPFWPSVLFVMFVVRALCFLFFSYLRTSTVGPGVGALPDFLFCSLFPFQQATEKREDWPMCKVVFFWGGGCAARLFLLFFFPCSADHDEWDWPPCKVVFRGGNRYAECEKQPLTGGCSDALDASRFFFKQQFEETF